MKSSAEAEKKIEQLLNELTVEEKVLMCHGISKFTSGGAERFAIDELCMMDGPHGVRSEPMRDEWTCLNREEDKCTYLPTESALAATFNPKLARIFGETLGSEARHRGKDIILGPGVNIMRTPLCGRNFEYMSEDPALICKMAPVLVKGIESQDVAACVKHFALNNQELDRSGVNAEVSDRALHEIYLKGFYSAIIEGGASSVMGAYNRYKNQHLCHNKYLVKDLLKGKWGFKGVYLSDWDGCHDTDEAIFNGLDIEMGTKKPYDEYYLADAFLEKAKNDNEVAEILDDKARRILRLMHSVGRFSLTRKSGEFNTLKHQNNAYIIAKEAMVLLKNDENILPIKPQKGLNILVVGENAVKKHSEGGSSSGVRTVYEITPLEGIKNKFGNTCNIEYESGNIGLTPNPIPTQILNIIEKSAGVRAFKLTTYEKSGNKVSETVTYSADGKLENTKADSYKLELSIKIPSAGKYLFHIKTNNSVEMRIDGKTVLNQFMKPRIAKSLEDIDFEYAADFDAEQDIDIEIKLTNVINDAIFDFGWNTPQDMANVSGEAELLKKAQNADYVIYCGGLDHSLDTEGADKRNMELPSKQNMMIDKLAKVNKNFVVVLTAGSPVEMPWIDSVKSVLWMWYAGMEGGNALGDILCGNVVPSGKMPFTLPKKYEDTPVYRYGEYKAENCKYNEGIMVGYRGFDNDNIEPLFPFGHGLSYTEFAYFDLKLCEKEDKLQISFSVKNLGKITAKETVQLYYGLEKSAVLRPPKEMFEFQKIELKKGEIKSLSFSIDKNKLAYYDEKSGDFKLESGNYTIYIGSSSRDIRLSDKINIKKPLTEAISNE